MPIIYIVTHIQNYLWTSLLCYLILFLCNIVNRNITQFLYVLCVNFPSVLIIELQSNYKTLGQKRNRKYQT